MDQLKVWDYRIMFRPGYMKNKHPLRAFEDNIFLSEGTEISIPVPGYDASPSTAFGEL